MESVKFLIPARKNSKGLPFKNRKLLEHTIKDIPKQYHKDCFISTDDEQIISRIKDTNFNIHLRSSENAQDQSSTKSLVEEFIKNYGFENEVIVMLYLTYPERTFDEVLKIIDFFQDSSAKSLLCKKQVKSHPFLCMYATSGNRGEQIVKHDLYRRQEYPECFEVSHYVSIYCGKEVKSLNNNLYNKDTIYYQIEDKIDVDEESDLREIEKNDKNNSRNRN